MELYGLIGSQFKVMYLIFIHVMYMSIYLYNYLCLLCTYLPIGLSKKQCRVVISFNDASIALLKQT